LAIGFLKIAGRMRLGEGARVLFDDGGSVEYYRRGIACRAGSINRRKAAIKKCRAMNLEIVENIIGSGVQYRKPTQKRGDSRIIRMRGDEMVTA
jgi:hypothetical protein